MVNVAIKADVSRLLTRVRSKISALSGQDVRLSNAMNSVGAKIKDDIQTRIEHTRNKQYYVTRQEGKLERSITHRLLKSSGGEFSVGIANIKLMDSMTPGHYTREGYWRWQESGTDKKNYQIPKTYRGKVIKFYWEKPKASSKGLWVYINKNITCDTTGKGAWLSIDKVIHPGIKGRNFILQVDGTLHESKVNHIKIFTDTLKKVMEA